MLYSLLLWLCTPKSFRNEYGGEMKSLFSKRLRDASALMKPWVWLEAIADILTAGGAAHWDLLRQDLRYAFRSMRNSPGFAAVVILVTALGIGAATSVFTLADHILLRPLPFREPSRLVKISEDQTNLGYPRLEVSPVNFRDWKRLSNAFESMSATHDVSLNMTGAGDPERLTGASLGHEMFDILGVMPMIGRPFSAEDDRGGAPGTMLLSYDYWNSRFGGDPSVIGRKVQLDGEPFTIIGVMPRTFVFPKREGKVWIPNRFGDGDYVDRGNHWLNVVGRLKRDVTFDQAAAEMKRVAQQVVEENPGWREKSGIRMIRMSDELPVRSRTMLNILAAAAVFLVLIACANLANLILARSSARQKEIEVRTALGAGRERLVRQLLTESSVLALCGGTAGVLLANLSLPVLGRFVPNTLPVAAIPHIDLRVMFFALALTMLVAISFSVLPALRTIGNSGFQSRSATGRRGDRARRILVVIQVAASLALVASTGLLVRALLKLNSQAPGFTVDGKLVFRTSLAFPQYLRTATRQQFYRTVLDGVQSLPGVQSAAVVSFRPMYDFRGGIWPVAVAGKDKDSPAAARFVTPGYFKTMGTPLLLGRDFTDADRPGGLPVAVVSESFARAQWPGQNAVGRQFTNTVNKLTYTVAGVVADVRFRGVDRDMEPQMYFSAYQIEDNWFPWFAPKDFIVATNLEDPSSLLPSIRTIVRSADPTLPISDIQTFVELIENETLARRAQLWVTGGFSFAAFLLAGIGIHGLLSFAVSKRTQEIGLRRALGATAGQIASLVLGEAVLLSAIGAAIGLTVAYLVALGMEKILFGVPPADPLTIALAACAALLMTLLGASVPAFRALRVDPSVALRAE
ncbi:MAG: ABC transporter permease [Acidobacteria bacterium]|nr:ABC transporter permease [Acidobacteriota bacterium]